MTDQTAEDDALRRLASDALAEHKAGTCHLSEWSCSYCERGE